MTPDTDSDTDAEESGVGDGETTLADEIQLVDRETITPYPMNAKEHTDKQIEDVKDSIEEFGWDQPIVIASNGEIIKGHARYEAAKRLELDRVPVIDRSDLDETEVRASRIADNRTNESDWDDDILADEMYDLDMAGDIDIDTMGFDDDELDDIFAMTEPPEIEGEIGEDEFEDSDDNVRVVFICNSEDEAEELGEIGDERDLEWHVVDA